MVSPIGHLVTETFGRCLITRLARGLDDDAACPAFIAPRHLVDGPPREDCSESRRHLVYVAILIGVRVLTDELLCTGLSSFYCSQTFGRWLTDLACPLQ